MGTVSASYLDVSMFWTLNYFADLRQNARWQKITVSVLLHVRRLSSLYFLPNQAVKTKSRIIIIYLETDFSVVKWSVWLPNNDEDHSFWI